MHATGVTVGNVPEKTDMRQLTPEDCAILTSADPKSAAAISNHFPAKPRLPHPPVAKFGPVPEALTVVVLETGTPRERQTTHGAGKPPSPPTPPQSLRTLTKICEKLVSERKSGIWS